MLAGPWTEAWHTLLPNELRILLIYWCFCLSSILILQRMTTLFLVLLVSQLPTSPTLPKMCQCAEQRPRTGQADFLPEILNLQLSSQAKSHPHILLANSFLLSFLLKFILSCLQSAFHEAPAPPKAKAKTKASKAKKAVLKGICSHTQKKIRTSPTFW